MKKLLIIATLLTSSLLAKEYYAKAEPKEIYTISSNVVGQVMFSDELKEGAILDRAEYIVIDDELDQVELIQVSQKIEILERTVQINEEMLANFKEIVKRKTQNYEKIKSLKIKSSVEKDREFYDLITTQNQYFSTQKELENLKIQENDLHLRKVQLQRSIKDKHLSANEKVLYKLMVKKGQVVAMATPLAQVADISKAKLSIFVNKNDLEGIKSKIIYIDGERSAYKITRLWNIADEQHLSSYKLEILIDAPKYFSKLIKVEFKSE